MLGNRGCIQTLPLPSALTVQKCSDEATRPDIPFPIKMSAVGSTVSLGRMSGCTESGGQERALPVSVTLERCVAWLGCWWLKAGTSLKLILYLTSLVSKKSEGYHGNLQNSLVASNSGYSSYLLS